MKKKSILSVVLAGIVTLGLVGCGGANNTASKDSKNDKVIKIGVTPKPHKEIVDIAKPLLEKQGYTVEITEFNDYVQPNTAVSEGSLDANFFQHTPYLNEQNQSKGFKLVSVGPIHLEPMGLYSKLQILDINLPPPSINVLSWLSFFKLPNLSANTPATGFPDASFNVPWKSVISTISKIFSLSAAYPIAGKAANKVIAKNRLVKNAVIWVDFNSFFQKNSP